ncbi:LytR family transcriptional regulator [Solihabitans fulvus]|uniref:LytR family transcriptional regulator n=2 Tax=Solihabitans fulvus TaxID=1892852 RepID=A0A5B2XTT2_9PSEU|nr:LytR family transcriptional regulator [Solihabitans fulvus]
MVASGVAWATYQDLDAGMQRSDAIAADAPRSPGGADGAVNILLMGLTTRLDLNGDPLPEDLLRRLNAGESDRGGYNANTLMLLHVPNNGSPATAFSVPRDDYVDFVGVPAGPKQGKIKEAYGRAKEIEEDRLTANGLRDRHELERLGREAGRRAQVETVRAFLNVPIDHLVELSLVGFYHLADALGGVDVCLNNATRDHFSGANFPAGRQHLDAAQALSFVRQRHELANGDLDRTRRQQAFLASVTRQLKGRGVFSDLGALRALLGVAKQDVVLDSGWDILDFIRQAPNLAGGVQFRTLPILDVTTVDGQIVNTVDRAAVRAMVSAPAVRSAPGTSAVAGPRPALTAPGSGERQRVSEILVIDEGPGGGEAANGIPCVD